MLSSVLVVLGTILAATSRADAGAFAAIVTVGYLVIQYRRKVVPWAAIAVVGIAGVIGVLGFFSGEQSGAALVETGSVDETSMAGLKLLV